MLILQWNINGLYAHLEKLNILVNKNIPKLICIQETNFRDNNVYSLRNYICHHKNRIEQKIASGGVAIYSRNDCSANQIPLITHYEAVAVSFVYKNVKISLLNIYIPNNKEINPNELQQLVDKLPQPRIILGDFNSHNIIWGSTTTNQRGKQIENFIENNNFNVLNSGDGTRFNVFTGGFSSIDLAFCDPRLSADLSWNTEAYTYGSDHIPIYINHSQIPYCIKTVQSPKWNIKKANWNAYEQHIEKNLIHLDYNKDINQLVQQFTDYIVEAANTSIGKISPTNNKKLVPWWNKDCEKAIKNSKIAFRKLKKHNTEENRLTYKRLETHTKYIVKKSKKESWQNFCSTINSQTTTSELWQKIKRMKGHRTFTGITAITHKNKYLVSDRDIAGALADHYEQISSNGSLDAAFLKYKTNKEKKEIEATTDETNPLDHSITLDELKDALRNCQNSSPGHDDVPYVFLQHLPPSATEQLLKIYNVIFTTQVFPQSWSTSIILPILKPNKPKDDVRSYRPISLTCTMCKLLERIINNRLTWYLEQGKLLDNAQCGFRKNRSSNDNIVSLESDVHEAFANNQKVLAVSLDVEKAYDITWKFRIIKTLHSWGVNGHILAFIKNFLKNRHFKVRTNNIQSETKFSENGIPQGSVLSTTLFLISINDVAKQVKNPVKISMFADDIMIYVKGKNLKTMEKLIQNTIDKITSWSHLAGFKFSSEKTKSIIFSKRKPPSGSCVKMYETPLECVDHLKFLGVIFDNKMNWKKHIDYVKSSCSKALNIMKTLAHYSWGADTNKLLHIYRSLIRSRIDYGCIAYSTAKNSYLKSIDTIQNNAIRIATGAFKSSPIKSLHCIANEPPLTHRRKNLTLSYAIKVMAVAEHLNSENITTRRYESIFYHNQKISQPIYERVHNLCSELNYTIPISLPIITSNQPPWTVNTVNIDLHLSEYPKGELSQEILKNTFLIFKAKHPEYRYLFTDASSNESGVGAALVDRHITYRYKLPQETSVFTAELLAIHQALTYTLNDSNRKDFCICSDSLSSLQSIQNLYPTNPLTQLIKQLIFKNMCSGNKINFLYVPSHVGIHGNEVADMEAYEAARNNDADTLKLYLHYDVRSHIRKLLLQQWQNSWNQCTSHLKAIKPSVAKHLPTLSKRIDQVKITRLRIGHTHLTHSYHMSSKEQPTCEECQCTLTIEHLLVQCPKYAECRVTSGIQTNLSSALGSIENLENTINFLKITNLYEKL